MKWPRLVPTLRASDIHKGASFPERLHADWDPWPDWGSEDNWEGCKACLSAWIRVVFIDPSARHLAWHSVQGVIAANPKFAPESMVSSDGRVVIPTFNDSPRVSRGELAQVWNEAMESLGYVEEVK